MSKMLHRAAKIFDACLIAVLLGASLVHAAPKETLIKNATILTVTKGTIQNGSILIRDGKIAAVGKNEEVKASPDAKVIDATGRFVMPGIIDAHSHTAIDGGVNESSVNVSAMVSIRDVIRHDDVNLYRAAAGGVTMLNVLHGSANTIGGMNAVIKPKYGRPLEELFVPDAPPGIKFALGENPKRSATAGNPNVQRRFPNTRMGVEALLRDSFQQAREYMREWDEYEKKVKAGETVVPPRRDLTLEHLADILRGKVLVHAHCYRADEIVMLLNVADDFGFKIRSLQHVLEGYKVAPEIAQHGAGASTFADNWAYKIEAYDAIPYNMAIMAKHGIKVTVNSDSNERARRLYQEAAKAMKYGGVSEIEALKMITWNAAWQLGLEHRVGSIEVGKEADLALFNGHPFAALSRVEMTIIDGEIFFDRANPLKLKGSEGDGPSPGYSCESDSEEENAQSDNGGEVRR